MEIDALVAAVYRNELGQIERMIDSGLDVNATGADERTPLIHAVLSEHASKKTVELLIRRGAHVDYPDGEQKWTALHFAARDHKIEIIEVLLTAGADPNAVDVFGNTPLWRAVMEHSPKTASVVKLLVARGSDPEKSNKSGVSPRLLSKRMGKDVLF